MAICKTFTKVTHVVRAYCEHCGGELKFNGETYNLKTKKYAHVCTECGEENLLVEIFPYQFVTEEEE